MVSVRTMDQIVAIHRKLYENPGYYKTVAIDSLTELQKLDMREIMKEASGRNPNQDEDVPSMREWGKSGERIRRCGYVHIVTCHLIPSLLPTPLSTRTLTTPLSIHLVCPENLRAELPGFLDIVGFMYTFIEDDSTIRRAIRGMSPSTSSDRIAMKRAS